jgi:hypothetical protein
MRPEEKRPRKAGPLGYTGNSGLKTLIPHKTGLVSPSCVLIRPNCNLKVGFPEAEACLSGFSTACLMKISIGL